MSSREKSRGGGALPLAGIRVLDLSGNAAPHCGQLLALFGADVVLVEPERAHASRTELAWAAYNAGKRSVSLDPATAEGRAQLDDLVRSSHVVIDGEEPIDDFEPRLLSPELIHVSISAFGLEGPRSGWTANELVAEAAGGLLYLSGAADRPPAALGLPLASGVAGSQAACAVLIALVQRRRTGGGARIDVSAQESVANLLFTTQFMSHTARQPGTRGETPLTLSGRTIRRKALWKCSDGFVTWNLWTGRGMGRKNAPFFEWLREAGVPEAEELLAIPWETLGFGDLKPEVLELVNRVVADFFAATPKEVIRREAFERRILLYVIQNMADVATDEQLHERGVFRELDLPDGRKLPIVGRPLRSSAYALEISPDVPAFGAHTEEVLGSWLDEQPVSIAPELPTREGVQPFEGIRILDFGWAVVAPVTTKYMAIFGADVVKLEFRGRPDPTRMTGAYPLKKPGMDNGTTFISVNSGKRSIGVDINHPEARELIFRMAREADVISENFTPGTADRLGYGYEAFRNVRPDTIMLSLSMQGQTGRRASQPGLGNHLQAMCGIDDLTGFPDGPPGGPNQVLPDFIGPWISLAALIAALEHRHRTGEGQYIDVSQFEAIMMYLQPRLLEFAVSGVPPVRRGNTSASAAPHGVYPVRGDDRWIAIAVQSDSEWLRLRELLPPAARKRFPARLPAEERIRRHAELDAAVADWSAGRDGEALMTALQEMGIAAYVVSDGLQLLADPQLGFRGHYRLVEHAKLGPQIVDAPSFRISSAEPHISAGPLYAADTADVLGDWLGIGEDEVAKLVGSGALVF